MEELLEKLGGPGFMPHGHCYLWDPGVLWLNAGSDMLIAASYFSIPLALATFLRRRRDIEFRWIFALFAAFILCCGSTHLIDVLTVWRPAYWLEGSVKALTGVVSAVTAIVLWPLIPRAVALPSPSQLEAMNAQLAAEVEERRVAEEKLRALNAELEERVAARTAELERSNAELEAFAYVASHDLKSPLRAITNLVEWLDDDLDEEALPEESREHLSLLRDRAQRMVALVDGILVYSRTGREAPPATEVEPAELIEQTVELLAPPPEAEIELDVDAAPFRTAAPLFEQVLRNLVGNALKYGGDPPRVRIAARDRGDALEVTVTDNGPGIDPAQQDRVWRMFQRLDPDRAEGTGLGLAVVKKLVERRGGRVWVESTPGEGATFGFTWPKG